MPATVLPARPTRESSALLAVLCSPALLTRECLAGIVTTLALIPEVISFSFVSGVSPQVSLVASVVLVLTMSVLGGRPAMVTAAAGSVALVIGPMVAVHGTSYVLPTVLLAGTVQVAFGALGLARLARYIPRSVMIGFVNALGVLIFYAQIQHVLDKPWAVYPLFALTVAIVLLLPRLTTAVPAALAAIVVATALVMLLHLRVPSVGGQDAAPARLPGLTPLLVPLNLQTLRIVLPTALSVAFVGLLETLLTAKLVDDLTDTPSDKGRESWALGVANLLAGLWGGVAGCAMIGQTVVNVKIGGARTRISTAFAALTLLLLLTVLSGLMAQIPLVALAAVMMIVAIKTVNWHSLRPATVRRMPASETVVMLMTVGVTVVTGNLALGIAAGVALSVILFARGMAQLIRVVRSPSADGAAVRYEVHGPLFFASSNDLVELFAYPADPARVTIDFTHARIWDTSSVAALDSIEGKYLDRGATVTFTGLDQISSRFHARLTGQLGG